MAASSAPWSRHSLRSLLAALISLALVMSFFHGWSDDGDAGATVISMPATCDSSGKIHADGGVPHGDHCLSHVISVAPQDDAVTVAYVTRIHRLAAVPALKATDPASPFKPPRA